MKAMFVNQSRYVRYADAIAAGLKPYETRTRNMLSALVGERVAVVRTQDGKPPVVVGYVTVTAAEKKSRQWLDDHRNQTLIPPGSQYDCKGAFKWVYTLTDAEECTPYPLPAGTVRHGRSWCEWG